MSLKMLLRKLRLRASYYYCPPNRLALRQVSLNHQSVGSVDLVVPRNEDVGRLIYYLRDYESEYVDYLIRSLRQDDICFDVGANLGYYTVMMAKAVPRGKVYAFEPDPFCCALLQLNIHLNQLENVIVSRSALGAHPGTSEFFRCTDSAFNSFKDTARRAVQRVVEVPVTTVDEFMESNAVPRVNFVKVDVEGAEGLVLAGARKLFEDSAKRPRLLLLELFDGNHKAFGDSAAQIVESLHQTRYEPLLAAGERGLTLAPEDFVNVFFTDERPTSVEHIQLSPHPRSAVNSLS